MNKNMTVREFGQLINCNYAIASGVIGMLVAQGKAKVAGKTKNPEGQKGRSSTIYEIPNRVEMDFFEVDNVEAKA